MSRPVILQTCPQCATENIKASDSDIVDADPSSEDGDFGEYHLTYQCPACQHQWERDQSFHIVGDIDAVYNTIVQGTIAGCTQVDQSGLCRIKQWQDLETTNDPKERYCDHCRACVRWVENEQELEALRGKGICVAYHPLPLAGEGRGEGIKGERVMLIISPSQPPTNKRTSPPPQKKQRNQPNGHTK